MKTLKLIPLAVAVALGAACNKDRPDEKNPAQAELPAAPFTLTAVETRGSASYPWTVSRAGVTDSVNEEADDLYVTSLNSLVFTVTPDAGSAFAGFNVRSSQPSAVEVKALDQYTFEMRRPLGASGSEAVVEVWNGSGSSVEKVSFKVFSRQLVEPTHMVFLVDGKKVLVPVSETAAEAREHFKKHLEEHTVLVMPESEKTPNWEMGLDESNDWSDIVVHEIVIKGLYPENTSFDYIEQDRIWKINISPLWIQILEGWDLQYTLDKFKGSITEFQNYNTSYIAAHVECAGFGTIENPNLIKLSVQGSLFYQKYCCVCLCLEEEVIW